MPEQRPGRPQLVEAHPAVKDVTADQSELAICGEHVVGRRQSRPGGVGVGLQVRSSTLLDDPETAKRLGILGRERALREFSRERQAENLRELFEAIASAASRDETPAEGVRS